MYSYVTILGSGNFDVVNGSQISLIAIALAGVVKTICNC